MSISIMWLIIIEISVLVVGYYLLKEARRHSGHTQKQMEEIAKLLNEYEEDGKMMLEACKAMRDSYERHTEIYNQIVNHYTTIYEGIEKASNSWVTWIENVDKQYSDLYEQYNDCKKGIADIYAKLIEVEKTIAPKEPAKKKQEKTKKEKEAEK